MQFKQIAFFTILSLLILSGCNKKDSEETKEEQKNQKEYSLTTSEAKTLHLEKIEQGLNFKEFQNKAVLLSFFATWCEPCKAEIPHLNNLREKYKDDFEVIAVLLEDGKKSQELKDFIKEHKINYIVTNSKENNILAKALGEIKAIPSMFMYNKQGLLKETYVGIVPQEMLEIDIKKAIK